MVDLESSHIKFTRDATVTAADVAQLFGACVLYVLCKPDINVMKYMKPPDADRDRFPFFYASGSNIMTPSNSWLYSIRHTCGDYIYPLKSYGNIAQFCPWDPGSTPWDGSGSNDFPGDLPPK